MQTYFNDCLRLLVVATVSLLLTCSSDAIGQSGINGGKPIITFNTTGPVSIKTQSPPDFPGGEQRLTQFVIDRVEEAETPIRLGRKTWLTAIIDGTGKVVELIPTYDADPALRKEMARVGTSMPRWRPGTVNGEGVETKFQFLLRR